MYYLEVQKTVDVVKIANLMYNEAHIYLVRKYEKGHLFAEMLREKFDLKDGYREATDGFGNKYIYQENGRGLLTITICDK